MTLQEAIEEFNIEVYCEHCGSTEVAFRLKEVDDAGWCQDCDKETELLERVTA